MRRERSPGNVKYVGDPSLRLNRGSVQDDAVRVARNKGTRDVHLFFQLRFDDGGGCRHPGGSFRKQGWGAWEAAG